LNIKRLYQRCSITSFSEKVAGVNDIYNEVEKVETTVENIPCLLCKGEGSNTGFETERKFRLVVGDYQLFLMPDVVINEQCKVIIGTRNFDVKFVYKEPGYNAIDHQVILLKEVI